MNEPLSFPRINGTKSIYWEYAKMYLTKYHVRHRLGADTTLFINTLSGALDIFTDAQVLIIDRLAGKREVSADTGLVQHLRARGYLFASEKQEREKFLDLRLKMRMIERREPTVFAICPTYFCFFKCTYCYEGELTEHGHQAKVQPEDILAGITLLERFLRENLQLKERPYITFLGGEPLQKSVGDLVLKILVEGARRGYQFTIITNGFLLDAFIGDLVRHFAALKHIQITLDGPPEIHDVRRPLRKGGSTFERIAANIQLGLDAGLPIRLRTNVDQANVNTLPDLGRFILERGWSDFPNFKAYLAPTEDSTCQGISDILREDQLLALWLPMRERTDLREYLAVFDDSKLFRVTAMLESTLTGQGRKVLPRFSYCAATKGKSFVFGPEGRIYQCLRGVGDERTSIGTYFPRFEVDLSKVHHWMARDIMTLQCSPCANVATLQGGGCALESLNRDGNLHACTCGEAQQVVAGYLEHRKDYILAKLSAHGA
jgi:uncharacterized protein